MFTKKKMLLIIINISIKNHFRSDVQSMKSFTNYFQFLSF